MLAKYTYYPDGAIRSVQSDRLYTVYTYNADKNPASLRDSIGDEVLVDNYYIYRRLEPADKGEFSGYTEKLYYDRARNRRRKILAEMEERYKYAPADLDEYMKGCEDNMYLRQGRQLHGR